MRLNPNLLYRPPSICRHPSGRGLSFWVRVHVERNRLERLRDPHNEGGGLVVGELLAEAYTRAGVEGEEDEGIGNEVFLDSVVDETVRVKLQNFGGCQRFVYMQGNCSVSTDLLVPRARSSCASTKGSS